MKVRLLESVLEAESTSVTLREIVEFSGTSATNLNLRDSLK